MPNELRRAAIDTLALKKRTEEEKGLLVDDLKNFIENEIKNHQLLLRVLEFHESSNTHFNLGVVSVLRLRLLLLELSIKDTTERLKQCSDKTTLPAIPGKMIAHFQGIYNTAPSASISGSESLEDEDDDSDCEVIQFE